MLFQSVASTLAIASVCNVAQGASIPINNHASDYYKYITENQLVSNLNLQQQVQQQQQQQQQQPQQQYNPDDFTKHFASFLPQEGQEQQYSVAEEAKAGIGRYPNGATKKVSVLKSGTNDQGQAFSFTNDMVVNLLVHLKVY
eukprot:Pgem_evm2s5265